MREELKSTKTRHFILTSWRKKDNHIPSQGASNQSTENSLLSQKVQFSVFTKKEKLLLFIPVLVSNLLPSMCSFSVFSASLQHSNVMMAYN